MVPRDTTTGAVLEAMVIPALQHGGYVIEQQVVIGRRLGGRRHKVDVIATSDKHKFLISLKWQQVSGTAEQKVPFEAMCLAQAVIDSNGVFSKAYIVLGGEGWTLRDFYIGGGLSEHLRHNDKVNIVSLEDFIARANKGRL